MENNKDSSKNDWLILGLTTVIMLLYFGITLLFAMFTPFLFIDIGHPGPIWSIVSLIMQINPLIVLFCIISMITEKIETKNNSAYRFIIIAFIPLILFFLAAIFFQSFTN